LDRLREYSHISREGASLMGVSDAAERIGFRTLGMCPSVEILKRGIALPCILFWDRNHYVVCYRIRERNGGAVFYISDPASARMKYSEAEFRRHWISTRRNNEDRGILLALTPTEEFYSRNDEIGEDRRLGISRYFRYLSPYKWALAQIMAGMALLMALGLVSPFLTQSLVDLGIRERNMRFVLLFLVSQFILSLTRNVVSLVNNWVSIHMNARVNMGVASDFWTKVLRLPAGFFDKRKTGDIMQRLNDCGRIRDFLTNQSPGICLAAVNIVIYTCVFAFYDPGVLCVFLAGQALYILWTSLFLGSWKRLDHEDFEMSCRNNNKVLQMIQGVVDIKLNNDETGKRWEWEKVQAGMFRISLKRMKLRQLENNVSDIITGVANILITAFISKSVIDGGMTLGMMMAITYIMGQVSGPVSQLVNFARNFQDVRTSLRRLGEIHGQSDDDTSIESKSSSWPEEGDFRLDHVDFSYDGSMRSLVLKDVTIVIPRNKVTALVGDSGCGKTTVIRLLQGLYEPVRGNVSVGDVPLSSINPHLLRSKVGSVMQDGYIFSDSIAKNIAPGMAGTDKERLRKASRIANIDGFIERNPLGYGMMIGMEGTGLSQGQRQRVLIARAVYKEPDVLLFDEATNSLDSVNERSIMENLRHYYQGKTVVIAAHRLSTVRDADQIVVMKDGKVVESGTHEELISCCGHYYELIKNQL